MNLQQLRILICSFVFIASVIGAWFAGCHHVELKYEAEQSRANAELVEQVRADAINAVRVNQVLNESIENSNNSIKELASHAQPRLYTQSSHKPVSARDFSLDATTVGLLDAAAQVPAASAPERSDVASQAAAASEPQHGDGPAPVNVDDLVQYNFTLISLYNELAKRHDALVDFVEGAMKARNPQR